MDRPSRRAVLATLASVGVSGCASLPGSREGDSPGPGAGTGGSTPPPTSWTTGERTRETTTEWVDDGEPSLGPWPTHRHDPRNTARAPAVRAPTGGIERRWELSVNDDGVAPPPIIVDLPSGEPAGGPTAFVGASDGDVVALNAATGAERWRYSTEANRLPVLSAARVETDREGATVASGPTVFATTDTTYAIDAATGDRRWRATRAEGASALPKVAGGRVFQGVRHGMLAFDAATGAEEWAAKAAKWGVDVPAVTAAPSGDGSSDPLDRGSVVFGRAYGPIQALDVRTGERRWKAEEARTHQTTPAVADAGQTEPTVYAASGDVYAIDAATGERRWRWTRDVDGPSNTSPAVTTASPGESPVVVVDDGAGTVVALDGGDGEVLWRVETGAGSVGSPVIAGETETVVVPTTEGAVHALSATTGEETWRHDVGAGVVGTALADSTVFVGTRDGRIVALGSDR